MKTLQTILIGICLSPWMMTYAANLEAMQFGPIDQYASLLKKFSLVQPDALPKKLQLPPDLSPVKNKINTLNFSSGHVDSFGKSIDRYDQYYQGIPVSGFQVIYHLLPSGVTMVTGSIVDNVEQDIPSVQCRLSNKDAEKIAVEKHSTAQNVKSKKIVYFNQEISNKAILAYQVSYLAEISAGSSTMASFIIDANSGRIVLEWDPWTKKNY